MRNMSNKNAKARMGKWTVVMPSIPDAGTRHFDSWEQAKKYVDTKMGGFTALVSVDGKRYALKHALGQWEKYARPGAKAAFAAPGIVVKEDAQYIYYYPDEDDRATFADDDGKGAYTVKSNRTGKPVSTKTYRSWEEAVRASNAINEKLPPLKKRKASMSRPGAKVTAGRAEDLYRQLSSGSITYANAKQWERLVTEALRLPDYTPPGGDMSLHEIAEDLGGDLMALKTHSGPVPHAKAKAEKATMAAPTPHKVTVTDKAGKSRTYMVSDNVLRSLQGTRKLAEARGTAPAYDDVIRLGTKMGEVVEASKAKAEKPSDLEREDVKAGLKLMEKADKAVSDKIRTLIAEGKPQDQAVAIALDMKRRGEI